MRSAFSTAAFPSPARQSVPVPGRNRLPTACSGPAPGSVAAGRGTASPSTPAHRGRPQPTTAAFAPTSRCAPPPTSLPDPLRRRPRRHRPHSGLPAPAVIGLPSRPRPAAPPHGAGGPRLEMSSTSCAGVWTGSSESGLWCAERALPGPAESPGPEPQLMMSGPPARAQTCQAAHWLCQAPRGRAPTAPRPSRGGATRLFRRAADWRAVSLCCVPHQRRTFRSLSAPFYHCARRLRPAPHPCIARALCPRRARAAPPWFDNVRTARRRARAIRFGGAAFQQAWATVRELLAATHAERKAKLDAVRVDTVFQVGDRALSRTDIDKIRRRWDEPEPQRLHPRRSPETF